MIRSFHPLNRSNEFGLHDIGGADPATLLPDAASSPKFFHYAGSLTTPPCNESVLWINFLDPITFSQVGHARVARFPFAFKQKRLVLYYRLSALHLSGRRSGEDSG